MFGKMIGKLEELGEKINETAESVVYKLRNIIKRK